MLNARLVAAIAAAALVGCGGTSLEPKAKESVERLAPRQRAAAQPLVRLEAAYRAHDQTALCRGVYVYEGSKADCERGVTELLENQETIAVEVTHVALEAATAIATTELTAIDADGRRQVSDTTFKLVRSHGAWKVEFLQ